MLIDTHCHLHDLEWFTPEEQQDFLRQAHENKVEKIVCIGTNHEDSLAARDFAEKHDNVYWTYGIHPEFATGSKLIRDSQVSFFWGSSEATAENEAARHPQRRADVTACPKRNDAGDFADEPCAIGEIPLGTDPEPRAPCAIGEIGLDYHYDGYDRVAQIRLFEQMLQLALDYDLPVSLHLREAFDDAFAVLDNFPKIRGVVHSFTGSKRDLKQALARDFYIGVNGLVTYTTPALAPLERIVLETDAPFLTPVPHRGQKNGPQYIKNIAEYLVEKFQVSFAEVAQITTSNAERIFRL